jgi:hypothetical protein
VAIDPLDPEDIAITEAAIRNRGARVKLELPETDAAFAALKAETTKRLIATDPDRDPRKMDRLIVALKIMDSVQAALHDYARKGDEVANVRTILDHHYEGFGPGQGR